MVGLHIAVVVDLFFSFIHSFIHSLVVSSSRRRTGKARENLTTEAPVAARAKILEPARTGRDG